MMLGFLTVADIRDEIGSEISFGSHWLPIMATRMRKNDLGISLFSRSKVWPDPDISIPVCASVKVQGDIARLRLETKRISGSCQMPERFVEVRIKLNKELFPENASPDS